MKKLFLAFALVACFAVPALSQGSPPWTIQEIDGNPRVNSPTLIKVTNGTLSCTGKTCTITISGGGGGSPGGSSTQVQYNAAGSFGGISGFTSDGTNVTAGSGNLRATSPRITTGVNDSNGNELILFTATASAVNEFTIANAATGGNPTFSATGDDADINIRISPKGAGGVVLSNGTAANAGLRFASDSTSVGWYRTAQSWTYTYVGTTQFALPSEGIRLSNGIALTFSTGSAESSGSDTRLVRTGTNTIRLANATTGAGNLIIGTSAGAIGTSGAGVLAFTLSTEPSTGPTDTTQLYYKDFAAGDGRLYLRNEASAAGSPVANLGDAQTFTGRITFSPGATTAGINVGSVAGNPSGPSNADLWYNTATNELYARINGANVALGSGGGSGANPTASVGLSAVNGVAATFMRSDAAPPLDQGITPTWTGAHLWNAVTGTFRRNSIGTTSTTSLVLENTTAAAAGAQQYSPAIELLGNGWKTAATAGSQLAGIRLEARPVQGSTAPTAGFVITQNVNSTYSDIATFTFASTNPVLDFTAAAKIRVGGIDALIMRPGNQLVGMTDNQAFVWGSDVGNTNYNLSLRRFAAGVLRVGDNTTTGAGSVLVGTSSGAIGTSGAGVIAAALSTAPANATDTSQAYSTDFNAVAGDARWHFLSETGNPIGLGNNSIGMQKPIAANGASQAGRPFTVFSSAATASLDTAGAAAGGDLNLQAGAAARLTSGNANGGNVNLIAGAGIGTGIQGQILANAYSGSSHTQPQYSFVGGTGFGMGWNGGGRLVITAGGSGHIMANGFSVVLLNARPLYWSNSASDPDVADIGLNRHAANVLRVNPGGTTSPGAGAANLLIGTSSGAIGTSGAGVLAFSGSTAPSTSPTDVVQVYSGDAAATDHNLYARNEAGQINRLTGLAARNSSTTTATSNTTLANITGLTVNVEAGRTYAFVAFLPTTSDVAGGVKVAIGGTATATAVNYDVLIFDNLVIAAQGRATALGTAVSTAGITDGSVRITGTIVVNAAGTLTVQFAQDTSSAFTSTVLVGGYLQLIPIS